MDVISTSIPLYTELLNAALTRAEKTTAHILIAMSTALILQRNAYLLLLKPNLFLRRELDEMNISSKIILYKNAHPIIMRRIKIC